MGMIWIDRAKKAPYKDDSTYLPEPEYWDRRHPRSLSAPTHNLHVVVDYSNLTPHELAALVSLQGLANRTQLCIWLSTCGDPGQDRALQSMAKYETIDGYTVVSDWKLLFKEFAHCYRGAVVYDPQVYCGDTLATALADSDNLIATSADVAHELQIPVIIDLRGRFSELVGVKD